MQPVTGPKCWYWTYAALPKTLAGLVMRGPETRVCEPRPGWMPEGVRARGRRQTLPPSLEHDVVPAQVGVHQALGVQEIKRAGNLDGLG